MTEPVEEEEGRQVSAPLDDAQDEDEIQQPRTLESISSLEDLVTPKAPDDVADAVDAGIETDEEEEFEEQEEGEGDEDAMVLPSEEETVEEEPLEGPEDFSHIVKINGEEYNLSTDDLIAGYQQAAASQQKFQRAAEVEKAARTVIDNVLDPSTAIDTMVGLYSDQMGGDRDKAAEMVDDIIGKRIQKLIDLEEMTEDERTVHDLQEDKARMSVQLQQHQQVEEQQQQREYINYQNNQAVPLLDAAISKYNLPVGSAQDAEASQILAEYIRQGHAVTQDLVDQTVTDVINRRDALLHSTLSGMTPEDLLATNPELAAQVQQAKAEEIKASRTTKTGTSEGSTPRRRKAKTSEYTDSNEFFNDTDF